MITPASTSPAPPPIPNVALISPMAWGTFSLGNSSRMIPKASGKIAPPAPWMARPTMSSGSVCDSAATTEPTQKPTSTARSTFSLPNMSPRRPNTGVAIEAVRR